MRNMSGIMRAPSRGAYFSVPYSGTCADSDCILVISMGGTPSVCAYYNGTSWVYDDDTTDFSDENNVISFFTSMVIDVGRAAFIPGPEHV